MQEPVQRQRIAVAIERMQHIEPAGRRPLERAALEAELTLDHLAAVHFVGQHVPIEDRLPDPVMASERRSASGPLSTAPPEPEKANCITVKPIT